MYITVRLLNGFKKPLTYKIPSDFENRDLMGKIVEVPLRTYTTHALVTNQFVSFDHKPTFDIREITSLKEFPDDPSYLPFIEKIAQYHQLESFTLLRRLQSFLTSDKKIENHSDPHGEVRSKTTILTDEQQHVVDTLTPSITNPKYTPAVLHGVTSSGKTEIYKKLMLHAFEQQKSSIVLLPEVTLALQFEQIFKQSLPNIPIYSFHSGNTQKEKRILWNALLQKKPLILIGVHLPMLLPINNLGLIIIDEEHETGYQEKKHPKINSKVCALIRAHHYNIPIVLGSATPSLSSLYNVQKRNWHFFQLKKRFAGAFPKISVVSLSENKAKRRNFWISKELEYAIKERLKKKEQVKPEQVKPEQATPEQATPEQATPEQATPEQVRPERATPEQTIIFLNRRGFSFFIQCKKCSHIPYCPNCSVSLTLHSDQTLRCHYCNKTIPVPKICPSCKHDKLIKKGIGTQQVVTILEKLFPTATVARADMDTTVKKKIWQQTMQDFEKGKIDILVGTQTITKGYHFPGVTLVGILWADLNLHFPIFNASETTLQQLIQVAGRAGREHKKSLVIVQTMSNHEIFSYLSEQNYLSFYRMECAKRKLLSYPPYGRLVEIELIHKQESTVEKESLTITTLLNNKNPELTVLGPSKPTTSKINNYHRRTIYIKAQNMHHISETFKQIKNKKLQSSIHFTPIT